MSSQKSKDKARERAKIRYATNRDKMIEWARAWQAANPEKVRATKKRWKAAHKEETRANSRLKLYGITNEQWLVISKNGCWICAGRQRLSVDHDHETGLVRGALCGNCNLGLGLFKHTPSRLVCASEYLKKFGGF